jgi:hypothetical protein
MTAADGTPLHGADWSANQWGKVRGNIVGLTQKSY